MECMYCKKNFDRGQSKKRHEYYCRQKPGILTRKRACFSCARAKTRCDNKIPSCSRCLSKKSNCQYEIIPSVISKPITSSGTSARLAAPFAPKLQSELLFTILASIPHVFKGGQRLPPFIHPLQPATQTLQTCQALIRTYFQNPKATWDLIRIERDRIWFTYDLFDNWELVQAQQALYMYLLLRIIHKNPTDFDFPLLLCFREVTKTLGERTNMVPLFDTPDDDQDSFENWLFRETKRRMVVMIRILALLAEITDGVSCKAKPGFVIAPLPSKDSLWRIENAEDWEKASIPLQNRAYGMSTDGSLIELENTPEGITSSPANWETWCAELGELGILSAIAGSSIKAHNS